MLKIKWFGHSMWKISDEEITIITDPFTDIGYPLPSNLTADIILSSHDHFDHNNFELVEGKPKIINCEGQYFICGIQIQTFPTFHDESKGAERGKNLLMKFEMGGKRFLHCGDLGHMISDELIKKIGKIDVLMIPIGGHFTIDAKTAKEIVDKIQPTITLPMHYKTKVLDFPIKLKEDYLKLITNELHINSCEFELTKDYFAEPKTIIMRYYEN